MSNITVYNVYSDYLKDRFGEKVYKLPIKLPLTCPNRDGCVGVGGCIFCGEEGGSFENLSSEISVKKQVMKNKEYISKRYKANKFISYFQNFTNTYMPIEEFKKVVEESIVEDIVGISISTRPDSVSEEYLQYLSEVKERYDLDITMEIGLQTVNYHTLYKINRGHTLAEFIDSILLCKKYGIRTCAHLILNLPWDDEKDVIECAKVISALRVDEVKLHALYILEGTTLGRMYNEGKISIISKDEYIERVILFLEYLNDNIIIQRIIGRAPEENSLFVNWNESWWKIRDSIVEEMERRESYQGKNCDYLNGKALRKFKK
ncbi:TIGR01212 family radical SAM protein [Anaerosalibacter bizertensis]|uniref:TIGR01212 family radical SAM protein n=1 Tax=Anaerosalibacter bizertensis TaxID=932217 RepID=A0A9Q4ABK4_9FIRM|nr:TIGR01212 family radical SAM protein [Anaerosalibacter bizertensis]MBV1818301.1 TIGR01212 family radical SAM protein [Bacteroidales bacterium MSK.15.36]MBU5292573.1 TIGR01212 family radical SAM protein [Anaerosalibacter bizertensis]MCB5558981.1 TIGR01212 family radical SAM protein [Anaerosalibacter bizertensis]MCG4564898.1 TIGR01212 family radical SAM protein [Anaerosalibacter bizertensis]MCG4581653.1 TIGR01212 family radical SAM protein [Anaerosalibacter bizertensis]